MQGKISLIHDGITYHLTINFAAMVTFEEETGKNAFAMMRLMGGGGVEAGLVSARDLRALIFGGLKVHDPEMTLALAGDILDSNPDRLSQALGASMPEADTESGKGEPSGNRRRPKRKRAR